VALEVDGEYHYKDSDEGRATRGRDALKEAALLEVGIPTLRVHHESTRDLLPATVAALLAEAAQPPRPSKGGGSGGR
jgi:very-short-patch-repair endonuclease